MARADSLARLAFARWRANVGKVRCDCVSVQTHAREFSACNVKRNVRAVARIQHALALRRRAKVELETLSTVARATVAYARVRQRNEDAPCLAVGSTVFPAE